MTLCPPDIERCDGEDDRHGYCQEAEDFEGDSGSVSGGAEVDLGVEDVHDDCENVHTEEHDQCDHKTVPDVSGLFTVAEDTVAVTFTEIVATFSIAFVSVTIGALLEPQVCFGDAGESFPRELAGALDS